MNTTPDTLIQRLDTLNNPYTLKENVYGALNDARYLNKRREECLTRVLLLTLAYDMLCGWVGMRSLGTVVDNGLFNLYWKHKRLATLVEKVMCEFVDEYLAIEQEGRE